MSNERIDEFLSWRGRLDDPQGIPGEGLDDREASWERLMDKIRETPRRRRSFGYWLAAACILLALIPATRLFHDGQDRVITMRPAERPVQLRRTVSPRATPVREAAQVTQSIGVPEASRTPATAQTAGVPRLPRQTRTSDRLEPTKAELIKIAILTPPITLRASQPDSAATAIQITQKPLKTKPLRVVNINELPGGGGSPAPAITAMDASRHFEFLIAPTKNGSSSEADPAILKVKLSSSN